MGMSTLQNSGFLQTQATAIDRDRVKQGLRTECVNAGLATFATAIEAANGRQEANFPEPIADLERLAILSSI